MKLQDNTITIRRGLNLHLSGAAVHEVHHFTTREFAFHPSDFRWMQPRLMVKEGDTIAAGEPIFVQKDDERIIMPSPITGTIKRVVRGERRVLQSIIIEADRDTQPTLKISLTQPTTADEVKEILLKYGLWICLRQRPYSIVPSPDSKPKALFISCFDTNPLAPDLSFVMQNHSDEWHEGIRILQLLLGATPIHLGLNRDANNSLWESTKDVHLHYFNYLHPAGNIGTQVHLISPIDKGETVWFIDPQDVARIGALFLKQERHFEKMVALTGPAATSPCYYTMMYGANIAPLLSENKIDFRAISGNVLSGITFDEMPSVRFYDTQITLIPEGGEREVLGWLRPSLNKWSLSHTFLSWLMPKKPFRFTTSMFGGRRVFVMSDIYEKVFPFDLIPLSLLKACLIKDIDQMEALGIYEVDGEDFALCEVVCPSKMPCQEIINDALYYLKNN